MQYILTQPWSAIETHKKIEKLTFESINKAKEYFETTSEYLIPKTIFIKQYRPLDRQRLIGNESLIISKIQDDEEYSLVAIEVNDEKTYIYSGYVYSKLKEIKITNNKFEVID